MQSLVDKNPGDKSRGEVTSLHYAAQGLPTQGGH